MRAKVLWPAICLAVLGLTGCSVLEFYLLVSLDDKGAISIKWVDRWDGPPPPCDQEATGARSPGAVSEWLVTQEFDAEFSLWFEPASRAFLDCLVVREVSFASISDWNAYAAMYEGHTSHGSGAHVSTILGHFPVMGAIRTDKLASGATKFTIDMALARGEREEGDHIPAWSWDGGLYYIAVEFPCALSSATPTYRSEITGESSSTAELRLERGVFSRLPRVITVTTTPNCDFNPSLTPPLTQDSQR